MELLSIVLNVTSTSSYLLQLSIKVSIHWLHFKNEFVLI